MKIINESFTSDIHFILIKTEIHLFNSSNKWNGRPFGKNNNNKKKKLQNHFNDPHFLKNKIEKNKHKLGNYI